MADTDCPLFYFLDEYLAEEPSTPEPEPASPAPPVPPKDAPAAPVYGPAPEHLLGAIHHRETAPTGTRYCEELDAFVPASLPYSIRGLPKTRAPLAQRLRSGELFRRAGPDAAVDDTICAIGLTHRQMTLLPLWQAQGSSAVKYRGI
ncbi:uncharacterized protein LAESUDRAFT_424801 [Laetiporus sulphureus 93-53]|uniref:Uncharacterized protein n=1 Tax=Laetiporus sulphureus 93-53 TaxID=1314785 RepID=A0A165GIY1_9APHY|nr:uncharacterized protein LAESUDRAFT_424801 [Laetiporus sulphureus 93-53]KZT10412.1 hypothetical protein LAESUDRAFT_424801 [Laetiporus sulphureus 93-53]